MPNSVTTPKVSVFSDSSSSGISKLTAAELTSKYSGLTIKTPTASFGMSYRGMTLHFRSGDPVMCDTALLAALTAAGAPVA